MFRNLREIIFNNIFMIRRSWVLSRNILPIVLIDFILGTIKPFVLLIIPKYILDELSGDRRTGELIKFIVLYTVVIVFFHVANLILKRFSEVAQIKINRIVEVDNKKKWLYMDYDNFESGYTRDLAQNCLSKVEPQGFFQTTVLDFIKNTIQLVGYTYIIVTLHPVVLLLIVTVVVLNMLIEIKLNAINYKCQTIVSRLSRRLDFIFNCMINFDMSKEIRINKASSWLKKKYGIEASAYCKEERRYQNNEARWKILIALIDFVQTIVMYGYCTYQTVSKNISIGDFTVYLGAITAFSGVLTTFIKYFPKFAKKSQYINDYKEFIGLSKHKRQKEEANSGIDLTDGRFDIEFVDVSFKYPNTDRFVLHHINLKIKSGERVSIVGYNGAGKSTLIKLICRLYEPTEGMILVGGIDIATINLHDYRELLSVVFQDYILYWLTIKENIVLNREYDQERLDLAIEQSGLKERIASLDNGIDTELESLFDCDRMEFSGGEGQKLACARAYYKNAPIVILDEPTSSLDPFAESSLYENFNNIIGSKTSIYISHRLASTKFCDSIAVFVDGKLIERGTHQELMDLQGAYAEMFLKQAHYYIEDD